MFIDFIRVSQIHLTEEGRCRFDLPQVDSGFIYKYERDPETGDLSRDSKGDIMPKYISVSRRFVEGSYDSIYIIRCDGNKVEFEGNVGRFGRPDNLFNFDFQATIDRINSILSEYGLPPFTGGKRRLKHNPSQYDVEHGLFYEFDGAMVSELHLTENYIAGNARNAQSAIDWLSTQSVAHVRRGRAGESTTFWGSKAGRKMLKAYIKHLEMLVHRHGRSITEIKEDPVYQYCEQNGIVRIELEAKRLMLRDQKLRYLGEITMSKLIRLYRQETDDLLNRLKVDVTAFEIDQLPASVRMTASAYLRGENVRSLMSQATFYRHAKTLRNYGIDIFEPLGNHQRYSPVINVIQLQPIDQEPEWYWDHQRKLSLKVA